MPEKIIKLKIDAERCKGCLFCIDACPQAALEVSAGVNKRGLQYVILKHPERCTGCGLCALMCPDCAIEVRGGNG